ncbi:cytochrome P450 4d2 [Plutella xylostella]|uniref:cytochrome P450 4d2 n=1 Tax=Plutella xylostella TaxID=51655 RepID=UPI0020327050|nr:cytochrome P450 4d2 [Plutella xylostella]
MLLTVAVVFLATLAVFWFFYSSEYRRKLALLKTEPYLPFFGHVLRLTKNGNSSVLPVLEEMWNNLGRDKYLVKLGPLDQVIITKTEDIELILSSNVLIEKNFVYKFLEPWFGNGLLILTGKKWRSHRKMLTPAFHFKILESYVEVFQEEAQLLADQLLDQGDGDIEMSHITSQRSLFALCRTAIGFDMNVNKDMSDFAASTQMIKKIMNQRVFSSWKFIDPLYQLTGEAKKLRECLNVTHSTFFTALRAKQESMKEMMELIASGKETLESITKEDDFFTKKRMTFIELLLLSRTPEGELLTDEDIKNEVKTFMSAGHETTAMAAAFIMYCLAMNPDVQKKAFQEQLEISGGDLTKPLTYKNVQDMKYMERVVKESLRLYPSVVAMGRKITEPTVLKDGTELPVGVSVLLVPYFTHRNPEVFKDPLKFDPDRFLEQVSLYSYYPFSAGSRNCIGQKLAMTMLKCWMGTVIRTVELFPPEGAHPEVIVEITINSATGVNARARRRQY